MEKKSLLFQSHQIPNLHFNVSEILSTTCRSVVFLNCKHGKMLKQYRTGENVLFDTETSCEVVCITDLFAIRHSGEEHLFVKGEKYIPLPGSQIHPYSSHHIVQPTSSIVVHPIKSLLRKVMVYPDPESLDSPSCYVVVDFERPQIPLGQNDVIIPAYPISGDMVLVQGDNNELWHAHDSCPGIYK